MSLRRLTAPGAALDGALTMSADSTIVALDSVTVNLVGRTLRLTAPARLRINAGRFRLDTLQLRGSGGAHIRVAGTYADSGAIDVAADATGIPYPFWRQRSGSDSVRGRINANVRLRGTAAAPTLALDARLIAEAPGALIIDSGVVTASYDRGVARVDVGGAAGRSEPARGPRLGARDPVACARDRARAR